MSFSVLVLRSDKRQNVTCLGGVFCSRYMLYMLWVQNLRGVKTLWVMCITGSGPSSLRYRGGCKICGAWVQNLRGVGGAKFAGRMEKKKKNAILKEPHDMRRHEAGNKNFKALGRCYYTMARTTKKIGYGKIVPIDDAQISASAWGVWCALATFTKWETEHGQPVQSRPGTCIPRVEIIAARAHISSVRTVQAAIKELIAAGYVRVAQRFGRRAKGAKGEQRSNEYTLYPRGNAPMSEEERLEVLEKMRTFRLSLGSGTGAEG